jgi:branched-chain amino acid transport system permease protein
MFDLMTIGQIAINGLLLGGIYALISIGLTIIFGVIRVINFAHGEFLMLSMYASFWLFQLLGIDPYVSILIIIPIFFIAGWLTQRAFIQPILKGPALMQIFITVGVSLAMMNGALFLWKADYRSVTPSYAAVTFKMGDFLIGLPRLVAFFSSIVIVLILHLFLKKTHLGRAIRAVAQDREAALLMGINMHRIYLIAFGIGTACVGVAGPLLLPIYPVFPTVGTYFVLIAFVVVVLGGMGNMTGAFIGGLIIGLIEVFSGFFITPQLQSLVYFVIFILLLLLKPSGLMGVVGAEEVGMK